MFMYDDIMHNCYEQSGEINGYQRSAADNVCGVNRSVNVSISSTIYIFKRTSFKYGIQFWHVFLR
jgi:hypothetical protein